MTIASPADYERAAHARLTGFLFEYATGGAFDELTLTSNRFDRHGAALRQRVRRNVANLDLSIHMFGRRRALPNVLGPVGIAGMYARRGQVQAAHAARFAGIPFTLSTAPACSLAEVMLAASGAVWFQLCGFSGRAFMRNLVAEVRSLGTDALVFTVDMPVEDPPPRPTVGHVGKTL